LYTPGSYGDSLYDLDCEAVAQILLQMRVCMRGSDATVLKNKVEQLARDTNGVRRVVNLIKVGDNT